MDRLPADSTKEAYYRFCELRGPFAEQEDAIDAFWVFLGATTKTVHYGKDHCWSVPDGGLERMNLLLSPHAKALLKAYDIKQAHRRH